MPDDAESIACMQAGDREAFRELIVRYQAPVFALVQNLIANPADREEIAQDVFLRAYANLRRFDARKASFPTWLLTIARNLCLNWRKRRRESAWTEDLLPISADTPVAQAQYRELQDLLDRALDSLPFEQRSAFVLAEILEWPHAEIALIEGIAVGTVKSRVSRARQKIQQCLKEQGEPR